MADNLRRPTDEEQAIIAACYAAATHITDRLPKTRVVGYGMGRARIEDAEHGRWTRLFGKPVVEVKDDELGDKALVLLVRVDVPGADE